MYKFVWNVNMYKNAQAIYLSVFCVVSHLEASSLRKKTEIKMVIKYSR